MKNPKIKNNLLIISVISIIAAIVFIGYLVKQQSNIEREHTEKMRAVKQISDSIGKREAFLQEFLVVDNNYILGQYDAAIEAYELISQNHFKSDFEEDLLKLRLRRIDEIISHADTISADIEAYRFSLNKAKEEIAELELAFDSTEQVRQAQLTELNSEIMELKEVIASKNIQLSKKDKVQVISFRNAQGNLIHYLGEVKEGMANGGGVGIFESGGIYKGNWKDNQRHGEGTYTWKDGHKYEGNFVEGVREGQGTYYWSSGEKYVGEWKNNMRNGQGVLYDKDNNVSYDGLWVDDKIKK